MGNHDLNLKTRQVAEAMGVSVSTIKRWVDAGALPATKTLGKHRLIALSDALRFADRQGLPVSGLAALRPSPTKDLAPRKARATSDEVAVEALTAALGSGDSRRAKAIIHRFHAEARDGAALADRLIRPVMRQIGHDWMVGSLDVFQEHQASQTICSAISELIEQVARSQRLPLPLALGATPEGDLYTIPLLLGELVLREEGWDVNNLGPNLPLRSLGRAVRELQPRLVFLSVGQVTDVERFTTEYQAFYESAAKVGTAVVLGGRAICPDLRARLVYASFGERMAHLSEFARRMHPTAAGVIPTPPSPSGSSNVVNGERPIAPGKG